MNRPSGTVPVEPPDSFYLSAAQGWIELGNFKEAEAELAHVQAALQSHAYTLELRWELEARRENWEQALKVARELLTAAPNRVSGWLHQAYALRRVADGGLRRAWEALLPAGEQFSKDPMVAYNLACYACQLGELDNGRRWFKRAVAVGKKEKIKQMALDDPDLEPLWPEIRQL